MRKIASILIVLIAIAVITGSVYGQDLNEPDNEIGDATEITFNQTVSSYISPLGDADYYKFYVDSSGIMQIKLDNVPTDMRARIDLWGKNGNWITRKDATNAGDTLTFEKDIGGPGWYYIAISDLEGKAHAAEYSFKFSFEPTADLNEPNSVIGDATEIEFNQTVYGYICPARDGDYYKYYVNSSGIMQIKLENVSSDMRTRIDLWGKNFNWITRKDATNAGDTLTFEKDIGGPGWYYIAISDLEGKAHVAEYSFKFIFEPAVDLNEPNSAVGDATEVEFDQTVRGYICPVPDVDYYKFHVNNPGLLQVKLEKVPTDMRARIDLYGKSFNWITRKDTTNAGDTVTLEKDLVNPGWYYIAISDLDRQAHSEEYAFRVLLT